MARKISAADRLNHDDSWLDTVQDVITKPSHTIKIYVDGKDRKHTTAIIYDNTREEIEIRDEYDNANKPTALNESLLAFIDEVPGDTTLKVIKTNVSNLIDEILQGDRGLAKATKRRLNEKRIKLINERPKRK